MQHIRRLSFRALLAFSAVSLAGVTACGGSATNEDSNSEIVTVYTGRHYGIETVFEKFTAETGIRVRFTTGSDPELRERLIAESNNTQADVIITADAANISLASESGVLSAVYSDTLRSSIPEELRAADGTWFALSQRLRVVMYATERVSAPPTTYAELGDPQWKGRLCLRPSTHPYTQSLVAGLINNLGEEEALKIVTSWVDNEPLYINSDSDIIGAMVDGECDVALANSYYLARLLGENNDLPVGLIWPDQDGFGAHLNVSAAGVTASAPNRDGAIRLLEWLATDGQKIFSDANNEFPADPNVAPGEIIASFGTFIADSASVRELGRLNPDAVALLATARYE